jgi:hypothetical protein
VGNVIAFWPAILSGKTTHHILFFHAANDVTPRTNHRRYCDVVILNSGLVALLVVVVAVAVVVVVVTDVLAGVAAMVVVGVVVVVVIGGVLIENVFPVNPLKPNLVKTLSKNSVRTSKRTHQFTVTNIKMLMLFKKLIAV